MDRYYKVNIDSETGSKLKAILERADKFDAEVENLREKYGFKNHWNSSFYYKSLDVVEFESEPDMNIWKKEKECFHGYSPRAKKGSKELIEDFRRVADLRIRRDDLDEVIGNDTVFNNAGFYFSLPEIYLFTVDSDWKCKIPKDCKEISNIEYNKLTSKK